MHDHKFIDPRLQAREAIFQKLHLSTFETMGYARAIQDHVEKTGQDIDIDNPDYQQLLRDYQVTRNLASIDQTQLAPLCKKTDGVLKQNKNAYANSAQLCAAAISALNHWRILSDIPIDLREQDQVTKTLREKFHHHMRTWEYILEDLSGSPKNFDS